MAEILQQSPVLAAAILMNICAGLYYNIGTKKLSFQRSLLINGLIKALLTAGLFLGAAYCFEATDLSSLGVTPIFIMNSAITLYVGKALISLGRIMGIEVTLNS